MLRRSLIGTKRARLRGLAFVVASLGVLSLCTLWSASQVAAQEAEPAAPAAPAAAPAATPSAPGAPAPETLAQKNMLTFYFEALGIKYTIAFLGISFAFVAVLVMNIMSARRDSVVPLQLVEGFEAYLNEKKYQEAYELAKQDESFLGKVLSAGLAKLSAGYAQAMEAMQEVGEEENMKLEHRLSYIALIGTISPMVGLLGTVDGMVASFTVIASSPTTPKPSELAAGISTALITTLIGLWLAIPAILVYGILKNRLARLVLEVGILSENLMSRFNTKKP